MHFLPKPNVLECFFDESFSPPLPAMRLRWDPDAAGVADRVWHFPEGLGMRGPAPERFGISIHRLDADAYQVRVLWNGLLLSWERLKRVQILTSSLALILSALETDLWYLLNQPMTEESLQNAA